MRRLVVLVVFLILGLAVHANPCSDALNSLGVEQMARMFMPSGKLATPLDTTITTSALGDYYTCTKTEGQKFCLLGYSPYAIGACVPNACTESNLVEADTLNALGMLSFGYSTQIGKICNLTDPTYIMNCAWTMDSMLYAIQFGLVLGTQNMLVSCGDHNTQYDVPGDAMVVIVVGLLFALLCALAFARHLWVNMQSAPILDAPSVLTPLLQNTPRNGKPVPNEVLPSANPDHLQPSYVSRMLDCFNPLRNVTSLLSPPSKSNISFLDGVRVFSIAWVVFGHQLLFINDFSGYSNVNAVYLPTGLMSTWAGQIVVSAEFAVDSFFYLSGFLVAAGLINFFEKSNTKGLRWVPMFVLHRFLRLTPAYMFALFYQWKVLPLMGSGPFWGGVKEFSNNCNKYWWTNLLYINNLYPWKGGTSKECFGHSWYLANDFQFFLLAPFMVVPYHRSKLLGLGVTTMMCVASLIVVLVLVCYSKVSPFIGDANDYDTDFYVLPYTRVPPYIVGVLTAMLWDQKKTHCPKLKFGAVFSGCLHMCALTVLGLCCYGCVSVSQQRACTTNHTDCGSYAVWSTSLRVVYTAWSKTAWAMCLAVLTVLALNNQLWAPLRILLCNFFMTVAARLSYCVYLIHISLIVLINASSDAHVSYHPYSFAQLYLGTLVLSFGGAFALSTIVEKPLVNLEMLVLGDKRQGGSKSS
eukprot:c12225_g1_i1.p1 GENE.c12225_g1_i1~~c12225_g1_i1.p1  ORF type:complete len:710 (+),score=161.17 c12225_g1_i1:50-2131(+)